MANELPEVVPEVQSMPTTGWFCQTSGSARRRVTKNSSSLKSGELDIEGIYDVAGVPGHTHNASAVISVDANYSAYRQRALNVAAGIWGYGALDLPVGLLTDSAEPDHAEERYDRAIERCVGYVSLFPENCTGHIREPTRSIGEIRTLVAPKARLDTLTYTEERAGWKVPQDQDDHKEIEERDDLVSDFPDVYLDVRPLTQVAVATVDLNISPGSLYLQTPTFRYRVVSAADGRGTIGTLADGTAWDGTLRFVWDDDSRMYRMPSKVSVTLGDVREVALDTGVQQVPVYDTPLDQNPAQDHAHRITVTFPQLVTSEAFDGFCWFGNLQSEEALNYAGRLSGLALAPRIAVEVTGVQAHIGPFDWIGMPAYRIPVGGTYAHPASDILQELLGDGSAADLQYNHWDLFDAFRQDATLQGAAAFDGLLRYQWRFQEAAHLRVGTAADLAGAPNNAAFQRADLEAAARLGQETFGFDLRAEEANSGLFFNRDGGILGQLTANHYDTQPDFEGAQTRQFVDAVQPLHVGGNVAGLYHTGGFRQSNRYKNAVNANATAAVSALPVVYEADGTTVADTSSFEDTGQGVLAAFTLKPSFHFSFPPGFPFGAAAADLADFTSDRFCSVPMTPLFYQLDAPYTGLGNFAGNDLYLGKTVGGNRVHVPNVICNCTKMIGDALHMRFDLGSADHTTTNGHRLTAGTLEILPFVSAMDARLWIRGWSMWLHPQDGVSSNFLLGAANLPNTAQQMRDLFRLQFGTGNKFPLAANQWYSEDVGAGLAGFTFLDHVFALSDTDYGGIYFETVANTAAGRKLCWVLPARPTAAVAYEAAGGAGTNFVHGRMYSPANEVYVWDQAAGNNQCRRATHAELHAENAQALNMYLLGPDWWRTHIGNDPYATIRADSQRLGAVFQSVKRISQHICAPVINPNLRIGASAPLNHDTRHLPPELRDFRLQLQDIDWGRLQTERVSLNSLTMYEFKDGTQKVGAAQNVMYLPQFREFKTVVDGNEFEFTCFSELGSPSYFCFFCRSATTDILQQPLIKTLSIFNETTKKKSNSVTELSIGQMYHLTQRNVHAGAEYGRAAYDRRQTVLLSAEDVGLLGLRSSEYQKAKRVQYTFSGTTNRPGQLYVVLVYNNRGLHIDGRRLQLVTLHE